jgi:multicomponent Na+:H+ antiporter subunit G
MSEVSVAEIVLVLLGAGLVALAGLGLLRLPDPLNRASAVSKAAALGVVLVLVAALVDDRSVRASIVLLLILLAHLITVPLSGITLGRASYRSGTARPPVTRIDEPARRDRPG